MEWFRALHLIGIVLWFSSLLQVSRMTKSRVRAPEGARETLYDIERRTQLFIGFPGLLLTVIMGLLLLTSKEGPGAKAYFDASTYGGYFHAKMGLVAVAIGIHVWLFMTNRKYKEKLGGIFPPLLIHIFGGLCLIGIMILMKTNLLHK